MSFKQITTPRGAIIAQNGQKAQLVWRPGFAADMNSHFSRVQEYVDSEVLRMCSPRVPFKSGMLEKSGILGTEIGSGEVDYIAPYAANQYYNTSESRSYDPQRGAQWFERMKAANGDDILREAQKIER